MELFGLTDIGRVRKHNEDFYLCSHSDDGEWQLLLLCDGMGGAQAGDVASELAARVFSEYFSSMVGNTYDDEEVVGKLMLEGLRAANDAVYQMSLSDYTCRGMGTTLVAAFVSGENAVLLNVGDSRAYLYHGGQLLQVTRDHSYVQNLVDMGEITPLEARTHSNRNIITRAVGTKETVRGDLFHPVLSDGDRLLLCSDGLTDLVEDEELAAALGRGTAEDTCRELVDLALERGAKDNVTVLVLEK